VIVHSVIVHNPNVFRSFVLT